MILSGCKFYETGKGFVAGDISFDADSGLINDSFEGEIIDASGCLVLPGFADTHIHGCFGSDTSDMSSDAIVNMALNLPRFGVTSFCPTTMTMSSDKIFRTFDAVDEAISILKKSDKPYASILGVHLEGPFLSPVMSGVQGREDLMLPQDGYDLINKLENDHPGLLRIIDIAPELDGAEEFIKEYNGRYIFSIAHSACDYDLAIKSIGLGVNSVTHVLNAMMPIDKRAPGAACAAIDIGCFVELICDGIHVMPPVLRLLFKSVPEDRMIVISDSMRGSGMPDGDYQLGDTFVRCENGRTYFGSENRLAGSVTNLFDEFTLLVNEGVDMDKAIRALSVNPLLRLGINGGSIKPGQPADLTIIKNNKVFMTVCKGRVFLNS